MALATFIPLPNSLIRAKKRFVNNGTANFGQNIPAELSGPPSGVIPNIPVGRNRNRLFHLTEFSGIFGVIEIILTFHHEILGLVATASVDL